jgi:GNAT superfamily N-acetyltransferase
MVPIVNVQPEKASLYSPLTYPKFRHLMDASNAPDVVALGAESRNNPLGLCLAKVDQGTGAARLLSIAVQPEYRGTGVASALIRALERELIARGCTHVCANYVSDLPSRPYWSGSSTGMAGRPRGRRPLFTAEESKSAMY